MIVLLQRVCEARRGQLYVPEDLVESLFLEYYLESKRGLKYQKLVSRSRLSFSDKFSEISCMQKTRNKIT